MLGCWLTYVDNSFYALGFQTKFPNTGPEDKVHVMHVEFMSSV